MGRLSNQLGAVLVRVVAAPVRWLPSSVADRLGFALGWTWYRLIPIRRRTARANIESALAPADTEAIVRGMYRHFGRSFVELLRFGGATAPPLDIRGRAHLDALGDAGALILTAHLGNWEVLVRAGTLGPRPVSVVTKRFRSGLAEGAWRSLRRGGPRLLSDGSARTVVKALRDGELVGYVLDQHVPPGRAVWVPFFGRPAASSPDIARLARLTGAAILPIFTWRDGDRHVVQIDAPLERQAGEDDLALTRRCVNRVEAAVRAHPEQWLWIHRRWKSPPADVAAALRASPDGVGRRRSPGSTPA